MYPSPTIARTIAPTIRLRNFCLPQLQCIARQTAPTFSPLYIPIITRARSLHAPPAHLCPPFFAPFCPHFPPQTPKSFAILSFSFAFTTQPHTLIFFPSFALSLPCAPVSIAQKKKTSRTPFFAPVSLLHFLDRFQLILFTNNNKQWQTLTVNVTLTGSTLFVLSLITSQR